MRTAGLQGLAAGRLFLNSNLVKSDGYSSSGFCFQERFFVTARHFNPLGPDALKAMFNREAHNIAKISVLRLASNSEGMWTTSFIQLFLDMQQQMIKIYVTPILYTKAKN